jgi:N-acetylneuraminate synthase
MRKTFGVPVGLSDHTMGAVVPSAAVALGACIIEKHLTLSRAEKGPDSSFSLEPAEFRAMVDAVRVVEKALGGVDYAGGPNQAESRAFRRSLFVSRPVRRGETLTADNVRCVRPAAGLHPRYLSAVLGKKAARDIAEGQPLAAADVAGFNAPRRK